MKAVLYEQYGSPDVPRLTEIAKPIPADDQILIKVHAVSINGSDKENLIGAPLYTRIGGLFKPRNPILGSDIAGRVEAVGQKHTEFKPGDEVFGEIPGYHGGFAEYVCTDGSILVQISFVPHRLDRRWDKTFLENYTMALKPASLSFAEAAAIPQGGVIAFRGIYTKGQVQSGQKVLINGGGGSGGSFAVQLAKLSGAEVTGVDNAGKLDFMRSLGADHVIDYTRADFTKNGKQYDFILDLVAYRSAFAYPHALQSNGTYYCVGGSVATLLQIVLLGPLLNQTSGKNVRVLAVPQNREDLLAVTELCKAGKIAPAIDKQYPFNEIPDALRYVSEGRAQGKVVIIVDGQ